MTEQKTYWVINLSDYDLKLLLKCLDNDRYAELQKGKWEMQDNNNYYYTKTKQVKRIDSLINFIKKQLVNRSTKEI